MSSKSGLGSFRKLPSGKWQLRYTDPNGIRRSARTTFQTKALAVLELSRIRSEIEAGTWRVDNTPQPGGVDPKNMTLRELAQIWREQRVNSKGQPLSPSTLGEYQRLIESTLRRFAGKRIREITTQQLEAWRAPEIKRAPNQTIKAYKHLLTLMSWAQRRAWIASNPCVIERGTAYTPSEPPIPTPEQVRVMADNAPQPFKAIWALATFGGLRKGEILELRRKDLEILKDGEDRWVIVNVSRGVIWHNGEAIVRTPKTSAGVRTVQLPLEASPILLEHLKGVNINPDALLFPRALGTQEHWHKYQINPYWNKLRALAGFPHRFHSLRAYHLTYYAQTGATLREIMARGGHSDIKTAMRYQKTTGRESELLRKMN
jgi:integrase